MIKQTLEQLYAEHGGKVSDKWSSYLAEYGRLLCGYRDGSINLLEIGVQNGGSLEIWSKFFPNAQKLVGCDINPDCSKLAYEDPRVAVVIGDANSDAVQLIILQHTPTFDVIIDDGSHCSSDIVKSFARYFPYLAEGGVFVAEDLHCSYWAEFEGGLFAPFSSIAFFKRLADIVNHEHWGSEKARADILRGFFLKFDFQIDEDVLAHVHSVEFVNSMCVVRKEACPNNLLGSRFISGHDETVVPVDMALQSSFSQTPSQLANEWTARKTPPDEDVLRLENELLTLGKEIIKREENTLCLEKDIQHLEKELAKRDENIVFLVTSKEAILNSLSWRLTLPLRFVGHCVKKVLRLSGI
ncbi:MAG: class I SAM-dependent methyltransferase [Methylovulum sp.]|nr:class I SAM-dependent methyltransferase [Methylovulum sp.]